MTSQLGTLHVEENEMTPAQTSLLKELIRLDREYRTRVANKDHMVCNDYRGIEIGFSCSRRTATVLCDLGLAEIVHIRSTQSYIFLGKYEPLDD